MRARGIKPNFFKNETLAEASPLARILFVGLWCLADKDGWVEYRPKRIRAEVFPYDHEVNIEELLDELRNFLTFIGVGKHQLVGVKNFCKHQSPHKNEKPSEYTDLSGYREITCNYAEFQPD